nr:ABC transporter ATP-binding protein [Pseudomarimonas arenosa]
MLSAQALAKAFPVASTPRERLRALLNLLLGRPIKRRDVLRDISFAIEPGASLGVIGENGAGKSTLLKLLVGVLTPTQGELKRCDSVGALLELGAGFDLERSGRENIALSAGLMGWNARQIAEREAEIIAFADIGDYIDEPVKHYSSGMVVRLGFSIIAAVRPQLLITDEVLAVGDESFQKKCIRWMEEYLQQGGTLLLVSHSMYHVQKLCKSALWLKDGGVEAYGDVFEVTQSYLAFHERKQEAEKNLREQRAISAGDFRLQSWQVNGSPVAANLVLPEDGALQIDVELHTPDQRIPHLGFGVKRADGTAVFGGTSEIDRAEGVLAAPHQVRYRLQLDLSNLMPGHYSLSVFVLDPEAIRLFDTVHCDLVVRGQAREFGMVRLPHRWG